MAAVEAALVLPLLVTLLVGVWEVGRVIEIQQILGNAAREAGRQASTGLQNEAAVKQAAVLYLKNAGLPTGNVVVTVTDLSSAGTDPASATQLDRLQVCVTIPVNDVRWLTFNHFFNAGADLSATSAWLSMKDLPLANASTTIPVN